MQTFKYKPEFLKGIKMDKNEEQIGGDHYGQGELPQHWDLTIMYGWDPFQYQIIKYLMRWKDKHDTFELRIDDLKKAKHFLEKYIEHAERFDRQSNPDLGPGYALDIRDPDKHKPRLLPAKDYEVRVLGFPDNGAPTKRYVDQ